MERCTIGRWRVFALTAAGIVLSVVRGRNGFAFGANKSSIRCKWPLLGLIVLGLIQLLPLRAAINNAGLPLACIAQSLA